MKKIIFVTSIFAALLVYSCSDSFLDVQPKAALSGETLSNKAGVNLLLVGVYALLDGWATPGGAYRSYQAGADNWVYGSVASDDAYKGTIAGDQPPISLIEQANISSDNIYFRGKWRGMYDGIARANDVLQILKDVKDATDAEKAQITAEARFLRGFFHFDLKKVFNNVPYIDEVVYDPKDLESTKVPNTADIWPKIEEDLKAAAAVLPVKQTQVGRPIKWAANAMLAKVYLFQKKYADAKPLLEAIVASNQFKFTTTISEHQPITTQSQFLKFNIRSMTVHRVVKMATQVQL